MPNYVNTIINLHGKNEDIKNVLSLVKSDDNDFDFNRIIPMPESLNIEASSGAEIGLFAVISDDFTKPFEDVEKIIDSNPAYKKFLHNMFVSFRELYERDKKWWYDEKQSEFVKRNRDLGLKSKNNLDNFGYANWYDWCINNWGTKWNSFNANIELGYSVIVSFSTVWDCPYRILEKFADICAEYNVTFDGIYADENAGCNTGSFDSETGVTQFKDMSPEALNAYDTCWEE